MAVNMRMEEIVSYATDVTGTNGTTVANVIVVVLFPIRDRRCIMWLCFPAVSAIKDVVDDFLCRMLIRLTAP
jgi:hypothetical protein